MSKPSKQLKLVIESGVIKAIHDDALTDMFPMGDVEIKRASHVEPEGCRWTADMSPVGGPILRGFRTREAALEAERLYLGNNVLV